MMQMIYKNLPNILFCCISDVNVLIVNNYDTGEILLTESYTSGKDTVVEGDTVSVIREPNLRIILRSNVKN